MDNGIIKVADDNGVFVIKMVGDVRLTLSVCFDEFIDSMFASSGFRSVVFDLAEAESIDSTTLGLMAKISLKGRKLDLEDPLVFAPNATVRRLLDTMGFGEILRIVKSKQFIDGEFQDLEDNADDENLYREKVLEAHKALVELNASNAPKFKELIQSLESY